LAAGLTLWFYETMKSDNGLLSVAPMMDWIIIHYLSNR